MEGAGAANIGDFNIRGTGGWRANTVLNPMWQSATYIKCENSENVKLWECDTCYTCLTWKCATAKMWKCDNFTILEFATAEMWEFDNMWYR